MRESEGKDLAYLANYTHRVAIANSRIREIDEATGKVTITYRDYADGAKSNHGVRSITTRASTGHTIIMRWSS